MILRKRSCISSIRENLGQRCYRSIPSGYKIRFYESNSAHCVRESNLVFLFLCPVEQDCGSSDVFSSSVCNNCSWKSPRQAWLIRAVLLLWFLLCGSCSDVQTPRNITFLISHKCSGVGTSPRPESRASGGCQEQQQQWGNHEPDCDPAATPEGTALISEGAPSHTWTGPGRVATATVHFPLVLVFNFFFFNLYGGPTLTNQKLYWLYLTTFPLSGPVPPGSVRNKFFDVVLF